MIPKNSRIVRIYLFARSNVHILEISAVRNKLSQTETCDLGSSNIDIFELLKFFSQRNNTLVFNV
jgi:hypothetical protein